MTRVDLTLADLPASKRCTVVTAAVDNPEVQSRLYALGIYPGVDLDILRFAPSGDPVQVRVGGTLLSIRKQEAAAITVLAKEDREEDR